MEEDISEQRRVSFILDMGLENIIYERAKLQVLLKASALFLTGCHIKRVK